MLEGLGSGPHTVPPWAVSQELSLPFLVVSFLLCEILTLLSLSPFYRWLRDGKQAGVPTSPRSSPGLFALYLVVILPGVWAGPVPGDSWYAVDVDTQISVGWCSWGSHDSQAQSVA